MAVDLGPAMAGDVLDDRQNAAGQHALAHRTAEVRDPLRLCAIGAVADHRVGARSRQVEHRQRVDRDAERGEIVGHQPSAEPGRFRRQRIGQGADPRRRRIGPPVWRLQPGDTPALLIDQHRRVGPRDGGAHLVDQGAQLVGVPAIAPEQHEAERIGRGEQPALLGAQPFAGAPQNDRARSLLRFSGQGCTRSSASSDRRRAGPRLPHHRKPASGRGTTRLCRRDRPLPRPR